MNQSRYNFTVQQANRIYFDPEIPQDASIKREAMGVLASTQLSYQSDLTKSESIGQLQNRLVQEDK